MVARRIKNALDESLRQVEIGHSAAQRNEQEVSGTCWWDGNKCRSVTRGIRHRAAGRVGKSENSFTRKYSVGDRPYQIYVLVTRYLLSVPCMRCSGVTGWQ